MDTSIYRYFILVRFIQKARRKSVTIEDKEDERPNARCTNHMEKDLKFHFCLYWRQLLLDKNKQLMLEKQMRQNIKQGHKSKNWDLIKQKITTAKVKGDRNIWRFFNRLLDNNFSIDKWCPLCSQIWSE